MSAPADAWQVAFEERRARVRAHPLFPRLVREVAIAEQPHHPGKHWLSRNSRTYGIWMTRGMPYVDTGICRVRTQALVKRIADDLQLLPEHIPPGESQAIVYGTALERVQQRLAS